MQPQSFDRPEKYGMTLLKALGHPIRLQIFNLLRDKEMTLADIKDELGTSKPNISNHLTILRDSGIVVRRFGVVNKIYNHISNDSELDILEDILRILYSNSSSPEHTPQV